MHSAGTACDRAGEGELPRVAVAADRDVGQRTGDRVVDGHPEVRGVPDAEQMEFGVGNVVEDGFRMGGSVDDLPALELAGIVVVPDGAGRAVGRPG